MYNNIPNLLKDLNIWLCFDDRDRPSYKGLSDNKIIDNKKAPRDLKGKKASNKRLYTFNECLESIKQGYNTGLGIYVKKGLVGIDYDDVIDRIDYDSKYNIKKVIFKKEHQERLLRDINLINSYTEISPSGKGIHIYLIANIDINTKNDLIEIYNNHFIRLTGNVYNDVMYDNISDRSEELDQLIKLYGLDTKKDQKIKYNVIGTSDNTYKDIILNQFKGQVNRFTDKEILDTMFNSKIGEYLKKLYYNDISDDELLMYKKKTKVMTHKKDLNCNISDNLLKIFNDRAVDTSNSGKSMTLIMYLYYYSYGDIKAIKRLFKKSALCKSEYLECKYRGQDKIDALFIPRAIAIFKNYREV